MAGRWEDYFEPGERLHWQGQPMPKRTLSLGHVGLAIFGLPFLLAGLAISGGAVLAGFGVSFEWWQFGVSLFSFFFGLPFLGAGIAMVFGPAYVQRTAHKKIRYALSDQRAYIASQYWGRKIESFPIVPTSAITLENDRSVFFHKELGRDSDGDTTTERKGFENIADAPEVFRLLRQVQDRMRDGG